jgi:mono/diheme cytochrome c family protein
VHKKFKKLSLAMLILLTLCLLLFKTCFSNSISENKGFITAGGELYKNRCANCHGDNAKGKSNGFFLSPSLKDFDKGYEEFISILMNGYGRMPAWGGRSKLTNEQINQLASYLKNISSKKANWK